MKRSLGNAKFSWIALVVSLPTENATARMRLWRALKSLGCAALRDGVYLLPFSAEHKQRLELLAGETVHSGGAAHALSVSSMDAKQAGAFAALFDRNGDYLALTKQINDFNTGMAALPASALRRAVKNLRRDFEAASAVDFFPGPAKEQTARALEKAETAALALISPGEPRPVSGDIKHSRRADYRRRKWATRKRPWIDRLASAWLIKRFIDPHARFLWLEKPRDCPPNAVGFDFDGAEFTHVGARVTFEVLLAGFDLEEDRGLSDLAGLVRYLDVGGVPSMEAAGLETIMAGARLRCADDDELLSEAMKTFDFMYAAFAEKRSAPPQKTAVAEKKTTPLNAKSNG